MTHRTLSVFRAALFVAASSALALAGCGYGGNGDGKKAPPPPKVVVGHPAPRTLTDYGEYTGYLDAIQRIEIRPQVHGRIVAAPIPEGTEIKKGTLLFKIDDAEYVIARDRAAAALEQAKADVLRTDAEYYRAHVNYLRAKGLNEKGAISADEYVQSEAAEKTTSAAKALAAAAVKQADAALKQAELNLSYTKIYAPIDGRVSRKLVTEGNLVGYNLQETHLTIMVDVDPIYVYFDVPELDILAYEARVKPHRAIAYGAMALGIPTPPMWSDAAIPLEVGVASETGYPHKGVINFREPRFESGTGTLRLRGILDNSDRRLSSGMYARVRFPKGPPRERLVLPVEAVMSGQQGRYVSVVEPRDPAADPKAPPPPEGYRVGLVSPFRTVATGFQTDDQQLPIEKGKLAASDLVVVQGVQKARPGSYVFYQVQGESAAAPAATPAH